MAIVKAYYSTDMLGQLGSDALYWYGTLTIANSSHIQIAYGGEALNYYGSFSYYNGELTAGTFTSINYTLNGNIYTEIYNFNLDLSTALDNFLNLDAYVLRGNDLIYGSFQDDLLVGYGGSDIINGNGGNDILYGEAGNDKLNGGTGDDILYGGGGNDQLNGGGGSDVMYGGVGNDRYYVNTQSDQVYEDFNSGTDTIYSRVTYTLGANLERLILDGANPINGTGNELNNILIGNSENNTLIGLDGNDRLDGTGGADTMIGGAGSDQYFVDHVGDVVVENPNEGVDSVRSFITYTLSGDVENLFLIGTSPINGYGNSLDNNLVGNDKANTLDGLTGSDYMVGKAGNDRYYVDNVGDIVVESVNEGADTVISSIDYSMGANLERLNLIGTDNINGVGNGSDNIISGNEGGNVLKGLAGNDKLKGIDGDDILHGQNGNDFLYGGNGNDFLVGGNGDDKLYGDAGIDTASYFNAKGGVTINLNLTSLQNTVSAGNDLLDDVENIDGSNFDDKLIGNSLENQLEGMDGADKLYGRGGNDSLSGGYGDDTLVGGAGNDFLAGDSGSDALKGGSGLDIFLLNSFDGVDSILDFSPFEDSFQLDQGVFAGLTETNDELDASAFVSVDTLNFDEVLLGPSILFEGSTGNVYYDSDGIDSSNATLIATVTVTDLLPISNADFDLV